MLRKKMVHLFVGAPKGFDVAQAHLGRDFLEVFPVVIVFSLSGASIDS